MRKLLFALHERKEVKKSKKENCCKRGIQVEQTLSFGGTHREFDKEIQKLTRTEELRGERDGRGKEKEICLSWKEGDFNYQVVKMEKK